MEDWSSRRCGELRTNFQTAKDDEQKKLAAEFDVEVAKGADAPKPARERHGGVGGNGSR
jgi:hypothetical protein